MKSPKKKESFFNKHGMLVCFALLIGAAFMLPRTEVEPSEITALYVISSIGFLFLAIVIYKRIPQYSRLDRGLTLFVESGAIGCNVWVITHPELSVVGAAWAALFGLLSVIVILLTAVSSFRYQPGGES